MAFICKSNVLKNILPVIKNQARCVSYHYPDWKPGPYPKTKEEREAAAKKYGLLPEEYEPYPDDGSGYGDYPNLPIVSDDTKDQNLPWTTNNTLQVRNYGEAIHIDAMLWNMDKMSTVPPEFPFWYSFLKIFGQLMGLVALLLFYPDGTYMPFAPKQIPHQGQTHYTFETVD